jgi:hypothetical protein
MPRDVPAAAEYMAVTKAEGHVPECPLAEKSSSSWSPQALRYEASTDGSVRPSSLRTLLQTPQRLIKIIANTNSGPGLKLGDFIEDMSGIFEKRSGEIRKMSMRVSNREDNLIEDSGDESANGENQSDSSAKYPSGCVKRRPALTKTPSYRARHRRNATSHGRHAALAADQDTMRRHRSVERKKNIPESHDPPGFPTQH